MKLLLSYDGRTSALAVFSPEREWLFVSGEDRFEWGNFRDELERLPRCFLLPAGIRGTPSPAS